MNPEESARNYSSIVDGDAIGTGHAQSMLDSDRSWSAGTNQEDEWMQIDLGAVMSVFGAVTQGRGDPCCSNQTVTRFAVNHSLDENTWIELPERFDGGGPGHR